MEPEVVITALVSILVALIGALVVVWRRQSHTDGGDTDGKEHAIDPKTLKTGDMSVDFWKGILDDFFGERLESIEEKLDRILQLTARWETERKP